MMILAISVVRHIVVAGTQFAAAPAVGPVRLTAIIAFVLLLLGHLYIITKLNRRFAEQRRELIRNGGQLHAIFMNLVEGILVVDSANNIIQINPAAKRILSIPEEVSSLNSIRNLLTLRMPGGEILHPDQWPGERARRGDYVRDFEVEVESNLSGRSELVELSTVPTMNTGGEANQVIIALRLVTERRRTEEMRSRMAAIVESSQDAITGADMNGIVTSWNLGAEKIFGYKAEEIIGTSIQCLLPPDRATEESQILDRVGSGSTVSHLETVRVCKSGKNVQVSLMICPIRDAHSKIIGAAQIARDITETRLLERQLRQSQKMEAIGQLTGGIAHDFNNLLAIVIGNLALMERSIGENPVLMNRLRPAQKAASRGADLTRRLLALASKEDLNPVLLHVEDVVRETIELAARALGPEIRIFTHFDKAIPPVYADISGLESALLNLAVNARDAMPKGGTLTFEAALAIVDKDFPAVQTGELIPGSYVRIAVADNGHGMSRETMERALEPFFTTKGRNKGTGLGLAMVYGFARQTGGTICLYSEVGFGTTISIYLPLATDPKPDFCEILQPALSVNADGTVLVVDDEIDLLEIARAYLIEMGYSALTANNAATALSILAQFKEIDVMITDIIMPGGMNGVELAEKARRLNPSLKVVYSSGFPADALIERDGTMVDGPLLRKPYHRSEFSAIIRRIMEKA